MHKKTKGRHGDSETRDRDKFIQCSEDLKKAIGSADVDSVRTSLRFFIKHIKDGANVYWACKSVIDIARKNEGDDWLNIMKYAANELIGGGAVKDPLAKEIGHAVLDEVLTMLGEADKLEANARKRANNLANHPEIRPSSSGFQVQSPSNGYRDRIGSIPSPSEDRFK